jgi:CTP synthase
MGIEDQRDCGGRREAPGRRAKYLFVTGGVMSGIGKGVVTSSLGKILQARGFSVTVMKIDPYLNVDAGTLNPLVHGEVVVTEDGGEVDMDIGTYERFLDLDLTREHNITTGQIYLSVIEKERRGDLLGKCVQIIPHVTDEIKSRIRGIAAKYPVDVVLVEIGGTVGDIEGLPFLEAARQMRLEEGPGNVINVHVTLVPVLEVVGEQKTKPTQHSVQELRRIGIQPDAIITRSKKPLSESSRKKIALFCNVEERAVFSSPDVESIYQIPLVLDEQGAGDYLVERFGLSGGSPPDWSHWRGLVRRFIEPRHSIRIAMCGKYTELADSYVSVNEALKHSGAACDSRVQIDWISTEAFEANERELELLRDYDGILIPGGFGARGAEGKIRAISFARSNDIPFLGICYGFQLSVVEFARSIGFEGANSTEIDPSTEHPVIDLMPEQKAIDRMGSTMRLGAHRIILREGTLAMRLYGSKVVTERHRHRYEVNPKYLDALERGGLVFSGVSEDGLRMEIAELPGMSFYMATQFHAEFKSRPNKPSPPYLGFVRACLERRLSRSRR